MLESLQAEYNVPHWELKESLSGWGPVGTEEQ